MITFSDSLPSMSTCSITVTLFSVSVPVLSAHKTSMLPKFWIEASRFTITPFFDMAAAPRARFIERIIGRRPGVRPTARATENSSDSRMSRLNMALIKNTTRMRAKVACMMR